jgi:hypothetical protein
MTAHELFAFMSPAQAHEILDHLFEHEKEMHRAVLAGVAQARKVRPIFLERQARPDRTAMILASLSRPQLEPISDNVIRTWLISKYSSMLSDFLDALKIPHEKGVVETLPETVEEGALRGAVDTLLGKYPHEAVSIYLHAFNQMNESKWANLDALLKSDPRLDLGG